MSEGAPKIEQCSICLAHPPYGACPGDESCAYLMKVERELREAQEACIKSAAQNNFVHGGDIPNTIEAARIALLQRCEKAERELTQAQARCAELQTAGADMLKWLDSKEVRNTFERAGSLSLTHPHLGTRVTSEFSAWAMGVIQRFRNAIDEALKEPR